MYGWAQENSWYGENGTENNRHGLKLGISRHGSQTEIVREQCVREVREHLFMFVNSLFTNVFETNMKIVKQTSRRTLFRLANMQTL